MGELGPFTTSASIEIGYDRPSGPPIEVDVEITGLMYCDDPEWGIEARDITAKVLGRDLTEEEIEHLDFETLLGERFPECMPCSPKVGDHYKGNDGLIWKVADVCASWGETDRNHYVILQRPKVRLSFRGPQVERRVVDLGEFDQGCDYDGEPLFKWIRNEPPKEGEWRAPGEVA